MFKSQEWAMVMLELTNTTKNSNKWFIYVQKIKFLKQRPSAEIRESVIVSKKHTSGTNQMQVSGCQVLSVSVFFCPPFLHFFFFFTFSSLIHTVLTICLNQTTTEPTNLNSILLVLSPAEHIPHTRTCAHTQPHKTGSENIKQEILVLYY